MKIGFMTNIFRHDDTETAFKKISNLGFRRIELASLHLDYLTIGTQELQKVKTLLSQYNLFLYGYYAYYLRKRPDGYYGVPTESKEIITEFRRAFEVAKEIGSQAIVTTPPPGIEFMDGIYEYCQEFDLKFVVENHWSDWPGPFGKPRDLEAIIKKYPDYIMLAPDTGWFAANGVNPLEILNIVDSNRIFTIHLKDVVRQGDHDPCLPGSGVARVKEFMAQLKKMNYKGYVTLEYEPGWKIKIIKDTRGRVQPLLEEERFSEDRVNQELATARKWALEHGAIP